MMWTLRRRPTARVGAVALMIAAGAGIACTPASTTGPNPTTQPPPAPEVRVAATGLDVPWGMAFLPDGTALVTERDKKRIVSLDPDGRITERHVLAEANASGEGGLLGLAVSPAYATDQWIYVYYTSTTDNRVARLRLGEPAQPILTGIPSFVHNNGGRIAFGPDGMLYIATGDVGDPKLSQDLGSLAGKILRVTPEGRPAPGNPFPGSPVYSYGHRNVQGLAWDGRGRLFAAELGEQAFDELNLIEPGGNYGWPEVEGVGDDPRYTNPVATLAPAEASPSGVAIVGDHAYLACLRGRQLIRIGLDGSGPLELLTDEYGRLRTVAVGPDGDLWITTSNRDGRLRGDPDRDDDRVLRVTFPPS